MFTGVKVGSFFITLRVKYLTGIRVPYRENQSYLSRGNKLNYRDFGGAIVRASAFHL